MSGSAFVVFWKWNSLSWHARGMILAAYGIIFLGLVLVPALRTRGLLKSGARAEGTVVDVKEHTSSGAGGGISSVSTTTYYPVVRFTAADGRTVEFTSGLGYSSDDRIPGRVSVRYRPDDPDKAEIDRATAWMLPAGSGLVGGLGLLVAGVIVYGSGPKAAPPVSAESSPSSELATSITSAQETPSAPEASSPDFQPIPYTLPDSIDVTMTGADGGTIQGTVKVAHLGNFRHTTVPHGKDPANGYFVAFVVNESSEGNGFDFGGARDFSVVVNDVVYDSENGNVIGSGRAGAELAPVTLNAGKSAHGTVTFDVPGTHGQLCYWQDRQSTPTMVWVF